jgi:hypothetical protein
MEGLDGALNACNRIPATFPCDMSEGYRMDIENSAKNFPDLFNRRKRMISNAMSNGVAV